MWQKTKHGLYKQFIFNDFKSALNFINEVAALASKYDVYPRWENRLNVVQVWLNSETDNTKITDQEMTVKIDNVINPPKSTISKSQIQHEVLKVYTDGGSRGNPGPSASGYVIIDQNNRVISDKGVYLGVTTNNQAEYTALKLALEECQKIGAAQLDVYMDSLLVVNQMQGIFKVKNRDLWPLHDAIKQIVKQFKKVNFQHIPREMNKMADAAVNRALDEELNGSAA